MVELFLTPFYQFPPPDYRLYAPIRGSNGTYYGTPQPKIPSACFYRVNAIRLTWPLFPSAKPRPRRWARAPRHRS